MIDMISSRGWDRTLGIFLRLCPEMRFEIPNLSSMLKIVLRKKVCLASYWRPYSRQQSYKGENRTPCRRRFEQRFLASYITLRLYLNVLRTRSPSHLWKYYWPLLVKTVSQNCNLVLPFTILTEKLDCEPCPGILDAHVSSVLDAFLTATLSGQVLHTLH